MNTPLNGYLWQMVYKDCGKKRLDVLWASQARLSLEGSSSLDFIVALLPSFRFVPV